MRDRRRRTPLIAAAALLALADCAAAQEAPAVTKLRALPAYERYEAMSGRTAMAARLADIEPEWTHDSRAFHYEFNGIRWRFDVATRAAVRAGTPGASGRAPLGPVSRWGEASPRAPVPDVLDSPNQQLRAAIQDVTIAITTRDGRPVTRVGASVPAGSRLRYGTAPPGYVELGQRDGMWWSPDSRRLAYYAVSSDRLAGVYVLEVESRRTVRLDVRDGRPAEAGDAGYYVYRVAWSPDGSDVLAQRANRRQNVVELIACSTATGACRVVVREDWPTGWVSERSAPRWLSDGRRFLWSSERTGHANLYLYDLATATHVPVTTHGFDVLNVVDVDEAAGLVYYLARSGESPLMPQLHAIGLDGSGGRRLTNPAFHHRVFLSPDRRYFVDVAERHDVAPLAQLVDATSATVLAAVAARDLTALLGLGVRSAEMFSYLAADGKTPLVGSIHFPSAFDPAKKYPVLVEVYGAPESPAAAPSERFTLPDPLGEFGFLVVRLSSRAAPWVGKRARDGLYRALGQADVDDFAQGIRSLVRRPYVDGGAVGVHGTSYGGYVATMLILRHGALVAAATASSPVTSWEQYNPAYSERYMGLAEEAPEKYRLSSALHYAADLRGRLLVYWGTSDRNVAPSHAEALVAAVERSGRGVDVHVDEGAGHGSISRVHLILFFLEHLQAESRLQ